MKELLCQTLGEIVTANPTSASVFERFGLDYCCGGKVSLDESCKNKRIDAMMVLEAVVQCTKGATTKAQDDWITLSIPDLVQHILKEHHAYLKESMPRISTLLKKVARVHGVNHPELLDMQDIYSNFRIDMEQHLAKEEQVLFPMLQQLDNNPDATSLRIISCPIKVMEAEHDHAGELLERLRQLAYDFQVPADSCHTYKILINELSKLEQDTHQHIHKENNILFQKVMDRL